MVLVRISMGRRDARTGMMAAPLPFPRTLPTYLLALPSFPFPILFASLSPSRFPNRSCTCCQTSAILACASACFWAHASTLSLVRAPLSSSFPPHFRSFSPLLMSPRAHRSCTC